VDLATATTGPEDFSEGSCGERYSVWYRFDSTADATIRFRPQGGTIAGIVAYPGPSPHLAPRGQSHHPLRSERRWIDDPRCLDGRRRARRRRDGLGRFLPLVEGVPGTQAWGGCPGGVAVAPDGRVYVGDGQFEVVRVLTPVPY
jgi:hypothetical protein